MIFLWEGTHSRRKGLYAGYKKSRKKAETPFQEALGQIPLFLEDAGIDQMHHIGLEADDMAGYLVEKNKTANILLVTTDEDWLQFMASNVSIQRKDTIDTYEDLKALFGYPPERSYMFKILRGGHDDLPSVKGLPAAIIKHLMRRCSSYEEFFGFPLSKSASLVANKPIDWSKWEKAISDNRELIEKNAELTLYHSEWINRDQIVHSPGKYDPDALLKMFDEYGLKSLIKEVTR